MMGRRKKRAARIRESRLDLRSKVQRRLTSKAVWLNKPGVGAGGEIVEGRGDDSSSELLAGVEGRRIREGSLLSVFSSSLAAASSSGVAPILKAA